MGVCLDGPTHVNQYTDTVLINKVIRVFYHYIFFGHFKILVIDYTAFMCKTVYEISRDLVTFLELRYYDLAVTMIDIGVILYHD